MVNLLQPQEIEVFYIIPTIRKYLALYMKESGKSQREIARILTVKESTISQYFSSKRANEIDFNQKIKDEIKKNSTQVKDALDVIRITQKILTLVREEKILCQVHKKMSKIPGRCNLESMGCTI